MSLRRTSHFVLFVVSFVVSTVLCFVRPLPTARAAITYTITPGSVYPANPNTWDASTTGLIGYTVDGSVAVDCDSELSCNWGILGRYSAVRGEVTISGTNASWTNSTGLDVGYSGIGILNINGGTVTVADTTYVARYEGSSGAINFGPIGGTLTTRTLYVSPTQLMGTGTITTHGLVSDIDLVFDSVHGSRPTFTIEGLPDRKITVNLDMSDPSKAGVLGASYKGNGSLTIRDGVVVNSGHGYVGYSPGSTGVATIDGDGSAWANVGTLDVGYHGSGTLSIVNGGAVSDSTGRIGNVFGLTGAVTVDGDGSTWTNSSDLKVGSSGNGTLSIVNGGVVSSASGYIGDTSTVSVTGSFSTWANSASLYIDGALNMAGGGAVTSANATVFNPSGTLNFGVGGGSLTTQTLRAATAQLTGTGIINAHGLLYDVNLVFDSAHGANQTLNLKSQADQNITLNLDVSDPIHAGDLGVSSLTIRDGINVNSKLGYIGYIRGSAGVGTVDGLGSMWANSDRLQVDGSLEITDGGALNSGSAWVSSGAVTVNGPGSKWVNSGSLDIGGRSGATVNVTGGGAVATANVALSHAGSQMNLDSQSLLAVYLGPGSTGWGGGTINNGGTVRIVAGAGLSPGETFTPISAGTWQGNGTYQALGGAWDGVDHVFTVSDVQPAAPGELVGINLNSTQRVLISSDPDSSVGVSFLEKAASTPIDIEALLIDGDSFAGLQDRLTPGQSVLGAWEFTVVGYGEDEPAYLSFRVPAGFERDDLQVWRHDVTAGWTPYDAVDLSCDGMYANFTVTGFSGYAVTMTADMWISGDANNDGWVDDKDASILGAHWQQQGDVHWFDGDFNGDGSVNDADAAILAAHWHEGIERNSSVPEPGTLALLASALASLALLTRNRTVGASE